MSHIAVDLKVIEVSAPAVARAAGVDPDRVLGGLVRLWHRCWSTKSEIVTRIEIAGIFGREHLDDLIAAMVAFGLLEHVSESNINELRVKGADRYLRIQAGRVAGGKAAAGNLKRGSTLPADSRQTPGRLPAGAPADSRQEPRQTPGLSPSTEHRAPNKEEKPAGEKSPADPRHAPLVLALVSAFELERGSKLAFDGRQAKAVTQLLVVGDPPEIEARWKRALAHVGFPTVATPAELRQHWNHFATDAPRRGLAAPIDAAAQLHTTRIVEDF